jgi:hypothetical protein
MLHTAWCLRAAIGQFAIDEDGFVTVSTAFAAMVQVGFAGFSLQAG